MRWKSVDASADIENAESSHKTSIYHVLSSLSHFLFHLTYCGVGTRACSFFTQHARFQKISYAFWFT